VIRARLRHCLSRGSRYTFICATYDDLIMAHDAPCLNRSVRGRCSPLPMGEAAHFRTIEDITSRSRDANAPELCLNHVPQLKEGAGNAGCPLHPQPCVRMKKAHKQVTTGTPNNPTFPARRCYGFLRALSGDRALLPPSLRRINPAKLDASVGASGPHDFFRPLWLRSSLKPWRPSHPALNVRDDREAPLYLPSRGH